MASSTRYCTSLLSLALLLSACTQGGEGYGFKVNSIDLQPGFQKVLASFQQELRVSEEAVAALENGVPLTVRVDMELRESATLTLLADDIQRYEIRYRPLSEYYELSRPGTNQVGNYPRLRHVLNELSSLQLALNTGPLAPGRYEFRARVTLESSRLPAPMRLPALFSGQWHHDSEWSTWPFEIGV